MKAQTKFFALLLCAALPMGCANMNKTQQGAAAGAVLGGAVGGASKGTRGAAVGAAVGAAAGGLMGRYLDQRQKELAQVVQTEKTDRGLLVTLKNDVLFDFNKTDLKNASKDTLGEMAGILAKYPNDRLRVAGFTDHIGRPAYNQQLSEKRARTVHDYLVAEGVKNPITSIGMGPIAGTGNDPAAVAMNRKVEIYIDVAPPEQSN